MMIIIWPAAITGTGTKDLLTGPFDFLGSSPVPFDRKSLTLLPVCESLLLNLSYTYVELLRSVVQIRPCDGRSVLKFWPIVHMDLWIVRGRPGQYEKSAPYDMDHISPKTKNCSCVHMLTFTLIVLEVFFKKLCFKP